MVDPKQDFHSGISACESSTFGSSAEFGRQVAPNSSQKRDSQYSCPSEVSAQVKLSIS